MEKKKLKLLGQHKTMTSQVPKSAASKPPTAVSSASTLPSSSSPKQPINTKPNVPAPVLKEANGLESARNGPSAKCASKESIQSDCIKTEALDDMHAKDSAAQPDIDCKSDQTTCMQKVGINFVFIVFNQWLIQFCFMQNLGIESCT